MPLNEHYEAVLADLQQMKADAEDGIRAIKRLMSRSGTVGNRVLETPVSFQREDSGSLPNRIVSYLDSRQGRSFRIGEIWEGTGKPNVKTLRGALQRLARTGKIGKHGRGRYRAKREPANAQAA